MGGKYDNQGLKSKEDMEYEEKNQDCWIIMIIFVIFLWEFYCEFHSLTNLTKNRRILRLKLFKKMIDGIIINAFS